MTDEGKSCGCKMAHSILMTVVVVAIFGLLYMNLAKPAASIPAINPTIQVNQPDTQRNMLTVSGNAQLSVSPDEATVYISVVSDNKTAKLAQENDRVTSDSVMAALKAAGLKAADIETESYYLTKLEDWEVIPMPVARIEPAPGASDSSAGYITEKGRYVERGYRLTHTIKATTKQIEGIGDLIDAAVGAGANGVDSVTFGLTKESEKKVRADALVKSVEAAKEKAQSMSQTAGATLGKVSTISEQNFYYTPYEYNTRSNVALDGGMYSAAPKTIISPQKVEISSSVTLGYELK
jgi:uncharacterized protein